MRFILCFALVFLCKNICNAQFTDVSTHDYKFTKTERKDIPNKKGLFSKRIVPVALIATGFLLSTSDFEKSLQKDIRGAVGNDFSANYDDYTRYAPIVQLYAADILGAKSKNHWFDQTRNLIVSSIISNGASTILKKEIYKERPGGLEYGSTHANSFPSGHTTTAFTTATVLYEEFIETNPLLAYSGYAFAIATGGLRMMNNAHYLSDVLVGAGIGILATRLVYHFDYLIAWNPFKKKDGIALAPQFNENGFGFYFTKVF
ncbi:phosphatase PAP2 family protein [Aquimarina gracilis]|uniref:Phosphatase PAP2 family protein n=1 Tax=Aquimarina gracilis TaxID=874422 RepID=A0ABU5ZYL7_9FLAO|nr:phosphatase PAP2 family protein [Aquimarina gracilis]MEB3346984.1 phosphatase PAP2 family protein [Aquimarina gracilis]